VGGRGLRLRPARLKNGFIFAKQAKKYYPGAFSARSVVIGGFNF
jgi:hypothetical protein